ncbi:sodium:solute symporter family transporter [Echinimonas agarilytica]|uniref:Transporter n=1 Tax=Echinimonas agarilytica TaxID=1215918 RepID=A0AA41W883_9GAMM|nr:transporter [Echinimonas agarilytica]
MNFDYIVMAGYFLLMVAISLAFKKMASSSSSDYFRGGGKMLWWMVGSTAFMTQFSAFTFTGAAGKAFSDGFAVLGIFFANAVGYLVAYLYFAKRFRQMRVDTPTEGIRARYDATNEQFFTWMIIPLSVVVAAVWLNGLGVFASAVFGSDISTTIWATGLVVLLISLLSGAWGVVASDFIQTLIIAMVSIACAIVALVKVGGPVELVSSFPNEFWIGPDMNYPLVIFCSFLFFVVKQFQSLNNMQDAYRFLSAKDSHNASKAALFAGLMMLFGCIIWFIPPWAAATLYPDAASEYSSLGAKARDAVYLVFAREAMPIGTIGLLMAGLFAATMSSMDSALNRNSGIFVRSFYANILRQGKASDKEQLRAGQVVCVINGLAVILMAQYFLYLKELSLFDLMMQVTTLLQGPILVPLCFGLIIKNTPKWAPWATVVFGALVSWSVLNVFTPLVVMGWFGVEEITPREHSELLTMITIAAHLVFTTGFFWATTLFYNPETDPNHQKTTQFFKDIEREVVAEQQHSEVDRAQCKKLGTLIMAMSSGLVLMTLIPNPLWGRLVFAGCALGVFLIGFALSRSGKAPAA